MIFNVRATSEVIAFNQMARRPNTEAGNVFEIPLADGGLAYGMVIKSPLAAFFDFHFSERPSLDLIVSQPVAFRIWIMNAALGKGGWKVIGSASVPEALATPAVFYKFDTIARKFSLYSSSTETPASREQCIGLECAAVWSACHVESRLADHFAGRPNQIVQSLSATNRP